MMTISELVQALEVLKQEHGDVPVRIDTLTHTWEPTPEIRVRGVGGERQKVVILNA